MTSPFIISPNGSGQALGSFASTFSFGIGAGGIDIHVGDVIVAYVAVDDTVDCTGITGSGLTFTKRGGGQALFGVRPATMSGWTAVATAPLTGLSLIGTLASSVDDWGVLWAVIRGTTPTIFDPNIGLPAVTNSTHVVSGPVIFSTTNNDDLLLFILSIENGKLFFPPFPVTPGTWNIEQSYNNSGGFGAIAGQLCSQSVSSPQTNATGDVVTPIVNSTVWYVDAFTANAPASPISPPFLIRPTRRF